MREFVVRNTYFSKYVGRITCVLSSKQPVIVGKSLLSVYFFTPWLWTDSGNPVGQMVGQVVELPTAYPQFCGHRGFVHSFAHKLNRICTHVIPLCVGKINDIFTGVVRGYTRSPQLLLLPLLVFNKLLVVNNVADIRMQTNNNGGQGGVVTG